MSQFSEQILEKIDLFHNGKLSSLDKVQFESEIASNPELAQEVKFQKEIIESIKNVRKVQLKTKLQGIEVSSKAKWMSKTFFGGIAASAVVGILGFTYLQFTKNDNNPNYVANDIEYVSEYEIRSIDIIVDESIKSNATIEDKITNSINIIEEKENPIDYNNIDAPNLTINTEGDNNVTSNPLSTLDDLESVEIMNSGATNIEIEFKSPNSKNLAYKFYDQKLYLFGKFNTKNPYEVIEINTKFGKEFYLKFDKSYYTLQSGKVDKTPLLKVENGKLIEKLENLN